MLQIASLLSQVHLPTCKNNSDIVANGDYACDIIVKPGAYADQCLLSEKCILAFAVHTSRQKSPVLNYLVCSMTITLNLPSQFATRLQLNLKFPLCMRIPSMQYVWRQL